MTHCLDNKAKLTIRESYGFRTFRVTEIALYQLLADSRSPTSPINSADEAKKTRDGLSFAYERFPAKLYVKPDAFAQRVADQRLKLTHQRVHVELLRLQVLASRERQQLLC